MFKHRVALIEAGRVAPFQRGGGSLVQRLAKAGWKFYGSGTCGWTTRQKWVFGDEDFSSLYVECYTRQDNLRRVCADITEGFPTWKNERTGRTAVGMQSVEDLEALLRVK